MNGPRGAEQASGVESVATDGAIGAEPESHAVVWGGEAVVFDVVSSVEDDHVFEAALSSEFCGAEHGEVVRAFGLGLSVSAEEDADGVFGEEGFRVATRAGCGAVWGGAAGEEECGGCEGRSQDAVDRAVHGRRMRGRQRGFTPKTR